MKSLIIILCLLLTGCKKTAVNLDALAEDNSPGDDDGSSQTLCPTLGINNICTVAGPFDLGLGKLLATQSNQIIMTPRASITDELGNYIISDNGANIIWYANRSATAVDRFGQTIAAGAIGVIAGTGGAQLDTTSFGPARSISFTQPFGLAYDSAAQVLYVGLSSTVRSIDAAGISSVVFGNGVSNTDGALGTSHACSFPAGLAIWNNFLYVACNGSHRLKKMDLTTQLAYTVAGSGSTTHGGDGSAFSATTGLPYPYGLFINSNGIYVTSNSGNRIRFLNLSGGAKSFWNGALVIPDTFISTIIGTGTAGTGPSGIPTSFKVSSPYSIVEINDVIYFVDNINSGGLYMANNSGVSVSAGAANVLDATAQRINASTGGYNGPSSSVSLSKFLFVYNISYDASSNSIHISDNGNSYFRKFDLATQKVLSIIGSGDGRSGFLGDSQLPGNEHRLASPNGLYYDPVDKNLLISDGSNSRIRLLSSNGKLSSLVGNLNGFPSSENTPPDLSSLGIGYTVNSPLVGLDVIASGGLAIGNPTINMVRVWNFSNTISQYFSIFIDANRVSTIAGDGTAGNATSGVALANTLSVPSDVKYDPLTGGLLIADTQNHCIKLVDSANLLSVVAGVCGTSGTGSNSGLMANATHFFRPQQMALDEQGNIYFADMSNHRIRFINRQGTAVSVFGNTVPAGESFTVACDNGFTGSNSENVLAKTSRCFNPVGVAISLETNQICFSNMGLHNIRCINRADGYIHTIAGSLQTVSPTRYGGPLDPSTEDTPATAALLNQPTALVSDGQGALYFTDTFNHIVRKIRLQ